MTANNKWDLSEKLFLATISEDSLQTAKAYGLGIEIDEFCEAVQMDGPSFSETDACVGKYLREVPRAVFHAPFAEIYPSAIDPLIRAAGFKRLNQAFDLAAGYGVKRMVVHGGFLSNVYFEVWFHERSVEFWRRFMENKPSDFILLIENVLEEKPSLLASVVEELDDPRIGSVLTWGTLFPSRTCRLKSGLTRMRRSWDMSISTTTTGNGTTTGRWIKATFR